MQTTLFYFVPLSEQRFFTGKECNDLGSKFSSVTNWLCDSGQITFPSWSLVSSAIKWEDALELSEVPSGPEV